MMESKDLLNGKLFHYTKHVAALDYILPTKRLKTNYLKNMNDPKESQLWAFSGMYDLENIYPDEYKEEDTIKLQFKLGAEIRNSVQAISFVGSNDNRGALNEMIWAHYGENHKGVCLEIDIKTFIKENNLQNSDCRIEPITYKRPTGATIKWDNSSSKDENISRIVRNRYRDFFLTKSNYWEKENEYRLILFTKGIRYLNIDSSLTGIYLGLDFPYTKRPSIDAHINEKQTKIFDLYYEDYGLKIIKRKRGDHREFIYRKYLHE